MHILPIGSRRARNPRVKGLRRVLEAALGDPCYAPVLRAAGMGSRDAVRGIDPVEDGLRLFPFSRLPAWLARRKLPVRRAFTTVRYPLRKGVQVLPPSVGRNWYPVLAGDLRRLQNMARLGPPARPYAEYAVLVLRKPGEAEASASQCDELWDAFQVPVYGILTGYDDAVMAYECEAGGGLHATADAIFEEYAGHIYYTSLTDVQHPAIRLETGLSAHITEAPCDCGRTGLRLATASLAFASAAD